MIVLGTQPPHFPPRSLHVSGQLCLVNGVAHVSLPRLDGGPPDHTTRLQLAATLFLRGSARCGDLRPGVTRRDGHLESVMMQHAQRDWVGDAGQYAIDPAAWA